MKLSTLSSISKSFSLVAPLVLAQALMGCAAGAPDPQATSGGETVGEAAQAETTLHLSCDQTADGNGTNYCTPDSTTYPIIGTRTVRMAPWESVWVELSCPNSWPHSYTYSGGPTCYTVACDGSQPCGFSCTNWKLEHKTLSINSIGCSLA